MDLIIANMHKCIEKMGASLGSAAGQTIDRRDALSKKGFAVMEYKRQKASYHMNSFKSAMKSLNDGIKELEEFQKRFLLGSSELDKLKRLADTLEIQTTKNSFALAKETLSEMSSLLPKKPTTRLQSIKFDVPPLPSAIKDEIHADLNELSRCYDENCLRSAIILCGRILECALHRKYFEHTNNDLLETSPGIGLGKMIAKMSDKEIPLPVGLNEQIHLINNVRIVSVHKKKRAFLPSKGQTQAIILYTLDTLRAIFGSN